MADVSITWGRLLSGLTSPYAAMVPLAPLSDSVRPGAVAAGSDTEKLSTMELMNVR